MNDDNLLEELRAQRELIRKHLEWLDQKIDDLDKGGHVPPPSDGPEEKKPVVTAPQTKAHSRETPGDEEAAEIKTEWDEELSPYQDPGQYQEPGGNDVLKAKLGCLLIFVVGTLLFLFFLFGLPYLMD